MNTFLVVDGDNSASSYFKYVSNIFAGIVSLARCAVRPNPSDPAHALPLLREFLNFCRIEKGLSTNSLQAYTRDLHRFGAFVPDNQAAPTKPRFPAAKRFIFI